MFFGLALFGFSSFLGMLLCVILLLIFSALISGSEAAFFSLSPSEKEALKVDENKNAKIVEKLLKEPKQLLATILIINNFVNVGIVILSSSILSNILDFETPNDTLRFILDVFVITFIILLVGEVIPKIYANKKALMFAKFMARPLDFLNNLPPFSWLKNGLVNGTILIQKYARKRGVTLSSDELEYALELTKDELTSEGEQKILEGIVKFGNTDVRQVMCSRLDVAAIDAELNFSKVLEKIKEFGYSRIPVFEENFDNILGVIYIKDFLPFLNESENFDWRILIRKPFFVPEKKKIDDLLKEFQTRKVHMAIVVDEYGGTSGLVTLEDVIEEIVGDITDEFDEEDVTFEKIDDQTFVFEGRTALIDFYKVLEIDGEEFETKKGESDTLGGFLIENAGKILKNNEFIVCGNYKLIVVSSDKKRIKNIKVVKQTFDIID